MKQGFSYLRIMLVIGLSHACIMQAVTPKELDEYVQLIKQIDQVLTDQTVDPAVIVQEHDIVQLIGLFEELKPELPACELPAMENSIKHIRSVLLPSKAPRRGTPATIERQINLDHRYIDARDDVYRNLLVTGSLVAPGFPSSGGIVGGPYLPLAGGTMTGDIVMSDQTGIVFEDASNTASVTIQAPTTVTPTSYTLNLPGADGSPNQALITDGAGNLSWASAIATTSGIQSINGLTAPHQILTNGTAGTAPNWTTIAPNDQVLNIPQASTQGVTSGLISNADYNNFNMKLSTTGGTVTGPLILTSTLVLEHCNEIIFNNADDSGSVALKAPCTTNDNFMVTILLPTTQGQVGQVLGQSPLGQLTWITTVTSSQSINLLNTATSCDNPNTLVLRDANGNFVANNIALNGLNGFAGSLINYSTSACSQGVSILSVPTSSTIALGSAGITSVIPAVDNAISLGSAVDRWSSVNTFTTNYFDTAGHEVSVALNPVAAGNVSYELYWPQTVGTSGQILETLGGNPGQLAWTSVSALISGTACDFPSTVVARDSTGSFAATTITLTSQNLLNFNPVADSCPSNNATTAFLSIPGGSNLFLGQAVGSQAIAGLGGNVAVGQTTLNAITSGNYNTAFGANTLDAVTTGFNNTAIGYNAGSSITTTTGNIFIGANTGQGYAGNGAIFIGYTGPATGDNVTYIGNPSIGVNSGCANPATTTTIYGCINLPEVNCGTGYMASFDSNNQLIIARSSKKYKENIQSLSPILIDKVYNLRPVEFNFKNSPNALSYGLIAEETHAACPELVIYNEAGEPDSVNYLSAQVLALDALIRQHTDISALSARCDMLTRMITSQNNVIAQLQQQINQQIGHK